MSKNLINTVVSAVKNFVSGDNTQPKMEIPENSDFLKWMYDRWETNDHVDKFKPLSIPAIPAGERVVLSVNIGKLTRSDYVIFFPLIISNAADICSISYNNLKFQFLNKQAGFSSILYAWDRLPIEGDFPFNGKINDTNDFNTSVVNNNSGETISQSILSRSLSVTYDYKKCCRGRLSFVKFQQSYSEKIKNNEGQLVSLFDYTSDPENFKSKYIKNPLTYENIGKGYMFGFNYGNPQTTGAFLLNKLILMESSWLELLADGTTELKIALKNVDSSANTSSNITLFVYNI